MNLTVYKSFDIDVAIRLPYVPEHLPCRNIHGHRLTITLAIQGPVCEKLGWVQDTNELKQAFEPIKAQLDHHYLNEVEGLSNPTAERTAQWIFEKLKPTLPLLSGVKVQDTASSSVFYSPKNDAL